MTRTLILMFHPDPQRSKANAALAKAASALPSVTVIDMRARFPEADEPFGDGAAGAAMLLGADRIVLQFPLQWYSTPALLKAWQDAVLTRMYYIHPKTEGDLLEGTPLMVAATAGNVAEAYRRSGQNHFTIDEMLTPLKATAHRCGLPWHAPHLVFTADWLSPAELAEAAEGYVAALAEFIARTPVRQTEAA